MLFKEHPYYDVSNRADWLSAASAAVMAESWGLRFRSHQTQIEALALNHFRQLAGEEYRTQRPHVEQNEISLRPTSDSSFQVYLEYFFNQNHQKPSPDSDYWWAIVNCPEGPNFYIIGAGWYVA